MPDAYARLAAALTDRYRIERELGAGGMATVYLAHDLRHDRRVALKVLKPELAAVVGAERFLAEIKTTANLQHPHILALFDSGQVNGTVFYVMPFVEGESLRDRLAREKQLPIDDALRVAREVGDALHYAHGHGVIHRDIKPENILLQGGHALVADFGIALAASKTGGSRMTETGMSLGTPTYMSPEQAMGERTLDARTDIYALGCVLYEMLTGDAPFTGSTAQAIVAKVLTEKPAPIVARRSRVPAHVEDAVLTALEKLPADRFATAAEFVAAIGGEGVTPAGLARRSRSARSGTSTSRAQVRAWRVATAVLALLSLGLAFAVLMRSPADSASRTIRVELQGGEADGSLPVVVAGAPDGSSFMYCTSSGAVRIRRWESLAPVPLTGPIRGCVAASYSPDGKSIAVIGIPTSVQIYSVNGDAPRREIRVEGLDDMATYGGGVDWASDDQLYIASRTGLIRLSPRDGRSEVIMRADSLTTLYGVDVLPGARHALVVTALTFGANPGDARVGVLDLRTSAIEPVVGGLAARYVHPGHILVVRSDGSMVAAPFDLGGGRISGEPIALVDSVGTVSVNRYWQGLVDVAADGTLLYWRSSFSGSSSPVITDRMGVGESPFPGWVGIFLVPRFSPDGGRISIEQGDGIGAQPVVRDLRSAAMRRLEMPGTLNGRAAWMPDGRGLTFISDREGPPRLYEWRLDNDISTATPRYDARGLFGVEWSRDGQWLLLRTDDQAPGKADILAARPGVDTVARALLAGPEVSEYTPTLSHDGRWLAYVSNESGRYEVRVASFPGVQERWQISAAGGSEPAWSGDGRELFYVADDGFLMVASIAPGPEFRVLGQRRLFSVAPFVLYGIWGRNYDVSRDGQRFLFLRRGEGATSGIVAVHNWAGGLRATTEGR